MVQKKKLLMLVKNLLTKKIRKLILIILKMSYILINLPDPDVLIRTGGTKEIKQFFIMAISIYRNIFC